MQGKLIWHPGKNEDRAHPNHARANAQAGCRTPSHTTDPKATMGLANRLSWAVTEVDLREAHVDHQIFHADDAAVVAVLVLRGDGNLSVVDALKRQDVIITQEWLSVSKISALQGDNDLKKKEGYR